MLRFTVSSEREKRAILSVLRSGKSRQANAAQMDTTDYLLSNPVNRELLLRAIEDVENHRNIIHRDLIEP
jgi:hypothetical protein